MPGTATERRRNPVARIPDELGHFALIHGRLSLWMAEKEAQLDRGRSARQRVTQLAKRLRTLDNAELSRFERETWGGTASQLLPHGLRVNDTFEIKAAATELLAWAAEGAPEKVLDYRPKARRRGKEA